MRIFLTGASGFIGLNILENLLRAGHTVAAVSNTSISDRTRRLFKTLKGELQEININVCDEASMSVAFRDFRPNSVIIGAAITPGEQAELSSFDRLIDINIHGALRTLRLAHECGCDRALFLSSASVYGAAAPFQGALDEEQSLPRPTTAYGMSKLSAEQLCLRFGEISRFDVRVVRIGTAFGPWESRNGVRDTLSPIHQVMELAAQGLKVILPRDGRRDFIYARDVATAISEVLGAEAPVHRLFNIGLGREWTVAEWCTRMMQSHGLDWDYAREDGAANVSLHAQADRPPLAVSRLMSGLGFTPSFDLEAAFTDYLGWLLETADPHGDAAKEGAFKDRS